MTWRAGFKSVLFRVCQSGCKIVALWRFAGRSAQKWLHAHLWSCTNRRKQDEEDDDADRQDKVETVTNGVVAKNSSLNEGGVVRMAWEPNWLVWKSAAIVSRLCFLFST